MKHGIFQRIICLLCITALLQVTTACGSKSPLSPKDPVSLTVWHYYNGSQQAAFDALTEEFNDTAGRELGISVRFGDGCAGGGQWRGGGGRYAGPLFFLCRYRL